MNPIIQAYQYHLAGGDKPFNLRIDDPNRPTAVFVMCDDGREFRYAIECADRRKFIAWFRLWSHWWCRLPR